MTPVDVLIRGALRCVRVAVAFRDSAPARSCRFDRRADRRLMRTYAREAVELARLSGQPLRQVWRTTA